MTLNVRPTTAADIPACVDIINPIIAAGGTTAYSVPYDVAGLTEKYLHEPATSTVALDGNRVVGFQACFEIEPGVYSIGSFTDRLNPVAGTGRALFDATLIAARANRATVILAKITSDNTGGLAYYTKMGFEDFDLILGDLTRPDGTTVDRVIKRFTL